MAATALTMEVIAGLLAFLLHGAVITLATLVCVCACVRVCVCVCELAWARACACTGGPPPRQWLVNLDRLEGPATALVFLGSFGRL